MEIEFYSNFIEIVRCGSILAAAENLHIAQSALSSQIKKFEQEFGTKLLIRNPRGVKLSEPGKIFYEKAVNIIEIRDSAYKEIHAWTEGIYNTLYLGVSRAFPDVPITYILKDFQKEFPNIKYEIYEMMTEDIISNIEAGIIEVGVIRTFGLIPPTLREELRMNQRLTLFYREDNPWISSEKKEVDISFLDGVPLAITRGFSKKLDGIFLRAGIKPRIMSVSGRSNAMMWAREGMAVAILGSEEYLDKEDGLEHSYLVSKDKDIQNEINVSRSLVTMKNRQTSLAAIKFIEFSKNWINSAKTG